MQAKRVVLVAVLGLLAAAAGCAPRRAHVIAGPTVAPSAQRHVPAPANPDLGTVMERFYQQVEGAHWPFAYAMLSPRYRAALDQNRFVALYDRYTDMDVKLRQFGDRTVVAMVAAKERAMPQHAHVFEETTTLAWDGEDWTIARIARRDVTRTGTRSGRRQ
jgi:hypothetical protein